MLDQKLSDEQIAWQLTDKLVQRRAGRVSAGLGPDAAATTATSASSSIRCWKIPQLGPPHDERVARYIELGKKWSQGHVNRMIKVPATPAGIDALEDAGRRRRHAERDADLHDAAVSKRPATRSGAVRSGTATSDKFKSVYSIFVSRVDVYTEKHVPQLSPAAQGMVGIVGAKRIWAENQQFWSDKKLPLDQEMIFASTGTKKPEDPPWKYVAAFAGSDIETNPPATNDAVEASNVSFHRDVDKLPPQEVLAEIDQKVNVPHLEATLMEEGVHKFTEPQKALLALIAEKRKSLSATK